MAAKRISPPVTRPTTATATQAPNQRFSMIGVCSVAPSGAFRDSASWALHPDASRAMATAPAPAPHRRIDRERSVRSATTSGDPLNRMGDSALCGYTAPRTLNGWRLAQELVAVPRGSPIPCTACRGHSMPPPGCPWGRRPGVHSMPPSTADGPIRHACTATVGSPASCSTPPARRWPRASAPCPRRSSFTASGTQAAARGPARAGPGTTEGGHDRRGQRGRALRRAARRRLGGARPGPRARPGQPSR